jgi:hypothetical protein
VFLAFCCSRTARLRKRLLTERIEVRVKGLHKVDLMVERSHTAVYQSGALGEVHCLHKNFAAAATYGGSPFFVDVPALQFTSLEHKRELL